MDMHFRVLQTISPWVMTRLDAHPESKDEREALPGFRVGIVVILIHEHRLHAQQRLLCQKSWPRSTTATTTTTAMALAINHRKLI